MIDDCWNRIGVRGDGSCPELKQHAHCHNCPVFSAAAAELLRSAPADGSLAERTRHFEKPKAADERDAASAVIFRVAEEWLALPTAVVDEIAPPRAMHSLPNRPKGVVLGVTNLHGELVLAVSLASILGLARTPNASQADARAELPRLMILRRDTVRVACPVDAVHGVHRYQPAALKEIPATLAKASGRYSTKLLPWNGRSVGVIDDQLLFYSVKRSVA
jgi:chemotaxis-related protein WspD